MTQLSTIEYTDGGGNDQISLSGSAPLTLNLGTGFDTLTANIGSLVTALVSASSGDLTINGNGSTMLRYV